MASSSVEIQNIKCMMQNMAKSGEAMQNIMMTNVSTNLVAPGSAIKERPKKLSQKGSTTNLVNSDGSDDS